MYRIPEIDIPVASPYYDRLRALKMQLEEEPKGTAGHRFLYRQFSELLMRARMRMQAEQSLCM